jgi:3-carboxy-cis,cis-muconate cycloisomerase
MSLLDALFRSPAVDDILSDKSFIQGMLDFESSLARAEARVGMIDSSSAAAISSKCRTELFDLAAIGEAASVSGNLAIPLVKQLTALVAQRDPVAGRFVHWGATSQDAIDTARVLQLRQALDLIARDLDGLVEPLGRMAQKHRATLMAGRTWMQQALPITLGVKFAGWLDALVRHSTRLKETRQRCLVLQFGGAAGTLAAMGQRGTEVAGFLASELKLTLPDLPWHSHRDRMAEIATTLGLCIGTIGKIARDISLHMQTEIQEISEPAAEGRGGSSSMPHKRNPVASSVLLAAAARIPGLVSTMLAAMVQEDERGLGGWQAEWETLPEIVGLTAGAVHHLSLLLPGLEINVENMKKNLNLTDGLLFAEAVSMALAEKIGKAQAHDLVQAACTRAVKEKRGLRPILSGDPRISAHLSATDLDGLFNPHNYLGASDEFVYRVVAASRVRIPAGEE